MPSIDLHDRPFDEGTIVKLEIFENYAKEWLPTFIMSRSGASLWIIDYFAGTGRDLSGIAGSPIRLLRQIAQQSSNIVERNAKVYLWLNEFKTSKFDRLKETCEDYIKGYHGLRELYNKNLFVKYTNEDFATLFPKSIDVLKGNPSLLYLDQNGMKFMADKYLSTLEQLPSTDFLYYLASSYFLRFGKTEQFQTNLKIDIDKARENPYKYIHRSIIEQLKQHLHQNTELKLYPFTIKKGANIYGITLVSLNIC